MLIIHIASHQANTHIQANNYTCIKSTRYFEVYVIVRKCPYLGKLPTHQLTLRKQYPSLSTKSPFWLILLTF
ncbi:hypothetical protein QL285_010231 [Trifolium repens]|nr:hypothetical protein QL285_010231 [Trifolium repens]